jgi:hypothetical protein
VRRAVDQLITAQVDLVVSIEPPSEKGSRLSRYKVRIDGVDTVYGGTSAVAPLWAGLFSFMEEMLGATGTIATFPA